MRSKHRFLLVLDAFVNLLLGLVLLLFPTGTLELLGLPPTSTHFYATVLGAVILGIGIALSLELWGERRSLRGLGLGGAIAINLCGATVLLLWLVFGDLAVPPRGQIVLWVVAIVVLGIGIAEIITRSWRYDDR